MVLNVVLASILVRGLSYGGLALSMATASTLQALTLIVLAQRRLPGLISEDVVASASRAIIAAIPLAVAAHWMSAHVGALVVSAGTLVQAVALVAMIGVGGLVYLVGTLLLGAEEFGQIPQTGPQVEWFPPNKHPRLGYSLITLWAHRRRARMERPGRRRGGIRLGFAPPAGLGATDRHAPVGVGSLSSLIGAMMLITPGQFNSPIYSIIQPYLQIRASLSSRSAWA